MGPAAAPTDRAVRVDGERVPAGSATVDGVCVVSVRAAPSPQNATRDVLCILAEITTVSLLTTRLSEDSPIRGAFDVTELDSSGSAPGSVLTAAVGFLINQIRLSVAIARQDAEVIWFFGATAYALPVVAARVSGRRVVLQSRGDVPLALELTWRESMPDLVAAGLASLVGALERLDFRLAHVVVTYSPSMARELGLDPSRPDVSCLGSRFVDLDRFERTREMADRDPTVGFVGRLEEEKGIDVLVAVARRLSREVRFVFVGDGAYRERLEAELAAEIDAGRVEVTGWVDHDEVPGYLNKFRLLVMPSQPTEGLPTTIAEAFACGTPVLATPVSGIPDLVEDGSTGFLLADPTAESVAARIESILEREDLESASDRCVSVARRRYGFEAAVVRYETILSKL